MKDYIKDLYENADNQDRFRDGYIDGEVYAVFMFAGEIASMVGAGLHKISTESNKIFRGTARCS